MKLGRRQFLIQNQSVEQVKATLQEFENKYQNFKSRWDFELLAQRETMVTAQIVDHGYETPREKGQSDSPVYEISLTAKEPDVLLSWCFRWKHSKRSLSWALLWILVVSRFIIFVTVHGDRLVLVMGIWLFWLILYAGWLLQNYIHDRSSQEIFLEMLRNNFRNTGASSDDQAEKNKD